MCRHHAATPPKVVQKCLVDFLAALKEKAIPTERAVALSGISALLGGLAFHWPG